MLIQKFLNISFINVLIKFFGYLRDMIVAFFFGTNAKSEVFFALFELQNLFSIFIHPLNFEKNFINIYLNLKLKFKKLQFLFAKSIFLLFSLIIFIVGILVLYNLDFILSILYPGFVNRIDFVFFEKVTRLIIIYNVINFIFVFLSSILQSERKLILNAICLLIPNFFFLIYSLIIFFFYDFNLLIDYFGLFLILTSLTQISLIIFFGELNIKKIFSYKIKINEIKKYNIYFLKDYSYSFYYLLCFKSFFIIKSYFLSYFTGFISFFYFSERIVYLPSTILTTALTVILLPEIIISKKLFSKKKIINFFLISIKISFFFMLPITFFIYMNSEIIINILFLRGQFGEDSMLMTSEIFKIESISLVFLSLINVFYIFFIFLKKHIILLKGIFYSIVITSISMYIFSLQNKPEFFAYSFVFYNFFQICYNIYYLDSDYKKVFWNFLNDIKTPLLVLLFSSAILEILKHYFVINNLVFLIISLLFFLVLIILFVRNYNDKDIILFLNLIKKKLNI